MTLILVVDDEAQLRRALDVNLRARDYDVLLAADGRQALDLAASKHPDLVILDLGLPDIDGVDVVTGLRGWSEVPIVVLSARDGETDKVAALDAGADDYVTKPFGIGELLARVRAALRRGATGDEAPVVTTADLVFDLGARTVTGVDGRIDLTPTEWEIVTTLVRNPGLLVTREQLLTAVWGTAQHHDPSLVRVHLANLRHKLEPDPNQPRYFLTEPGMGYRFQP